MLDETALTFVQNPMLDFNRTPKREVFAALPIFPLPNVVFMPGMMLPLNVFEPRYIDLVDHVLEEGQHIGVPLALGQSQPGQSPGYESTLGIGKLIDHQCLSDGRRLIRLEGLGRVRVEEELPQIYRFRRLKVKALPEPLPTDEHAVEVLVAQVERLAKSFDDDDRNTIQGILELGDTRVIVYALAALMPNVESMREMETGKMLSSPCTALRLQQMCLEECDPDRRVQMLIDRVSIVLAQLDSSAGYCRRTLLH